jgi:hypothetical protein
MIPSPRRGFETSSRDGGPETSYATLLPLLILLLTLVLSTSRDISILYQRKISLVIENAQAAKPLDDAARQAVFIDSLHTDLAKLAQTDPVAAQIMADFFGPSAGQKDAEPDTAPAQ